MTAQREETNRTDNRKIAIIGCGFVGSASAFALMQSGLFSEIALLDADKNRAEGEALDISHGVPFAGNVRVYAADYDDIIDAGIIVVTAGAAQKPGETRLDLVHKNVSIFQSIIPELKKQGYELVSIRELFRRSGVKPERNVIYMSVDEVRENYT